MATMLIPVLLIVVGVLIYALATNPKVAEIGRLTFFAGMLSLALFFSQRLVHLF